MKAIISNHILHFVKYYRIRCNTWMIFLCAKKLFILWYPPFFIHKTSNSFLKLSGPCGNRKEIWLQWEQFCFNGVMIWIEDASCHRKGLRNDRRVFFYSHMKYQLFICISVDRTRRDFLRNWRRTIVIV